MKEKKLVSTKMLYSLGLGLSAGELIMLLYPRQLASISHYGIGPVTGAALFTLEICNILIVCVCLAYLFFATIEFICKIHHEACMKKCLKKEREAMFRWNPCDDPNVAKKDTRCQDTRYQIVKKDTRCQDIRYQIAKKDTRCQDTRYRIGRK